jgi:hypothetical protein
MNKADLYADWVTIRTVELQKVATWMLAGMLAKLTELQEEIATDLRRIDPAGVERASAQLARLQAWLEEVEKKIAAVVKAMAQECEDNLEELADIQQKDEREALLIIYGIILYKPALNKIRTLPIMGASIRNWLIKIGSDLGFRLRTGGMHAVIGTEAEKDLRELVRGDLNPFKNAARDLETVTRTGTNSLPNAVLREVMAENPEPAQAAPRQGGEEPEPAPGPRFSPGWQQISILDSRTSEICRAYAWKKWDYDYKPIGHALPFNAGPPRHMYCRSRIVLIELEGDEVSEKTFKEWIEGRTDTANRNLFGKSKFELWQQGLISDTELIRQPESEMSIKDLRERGEMPKKG